MADEIGDGREKALRYLARREYGELELVRKLRDKGVPTDHAERIVADLKADNLVSDGRFVDAYLRSCVQRGQGPQKIAHELRRRGIAAELISERIDPGDEMWSEKVVAVLSRKYRDAPVADYADWARRARFLRNRGFTSDHVSRGLGRYSSAESESPE